MGWSRGVPVDYLRGLAGYWADGFDWRKQEEKLNSYPQFTTEIDGIDLHFVHVRSVHGDATPLLLLRSWPGSFVEFLDVVGPLVDPLAHGGTEADAFHVVIPSIPGHGFSSAPTEPGWTHRRIATLYPQLMARPGYERYVVQGGDIGAFQAPLVGRADPENVIGAHVNA